MRMKRLFGLVLPFGESDYEVQLRSCMKQWPFWLWVVGFALPCLSWMVLDYHWWHQRHHRESLLEISNSVQIAVTVAALLLMIIAVLCFKASSELKVGLYIGSVFAIPLSLMAGLIGSFAVSGLPIE